MKWKLWFQSRRVNLENENSTWLGDCKLLPFIEELRSVYD